MSTIRPMKAAETPDDLGKIKLPVLASAKIDGVRALVVDGQLLSASLKPIRNRFIANHLSHPALNGLDGELVVGSPTHPNCMQITVSGVMRAEGEPDFTYYVFDYWHLNQRYFDRYELLAETRYDRVRVLPQTLISTYLELEQFEDTVLSMGYEGAVVRSPDLPYKFGRSTLRENGMIKLKRFRDSEAEVIGAVEQLHNANAATTNALGLTERSSHQENKKGMGTLGALLLRDLTTGLEFSCGTGFTAEQRRNMWQYRDKLPGLMVTYKYFPVGIKDLPRHPVFKSFRSQDDYAPSEVEL